MRLAGECPVKHILDGYFRSSTDIKMRNCIHLTTQLHNNCTLNCMTCAPLRLGVQARLVSNASCYSYELTGKFRPSTAGRDWRLCGDEYDGMKVGNALLIQMVLSYCQLFWRFGTLESH